VPRRGRHRGRQDQRPEFGAGANTNNPVYGPTRNPFDLARICGGSSGGSAVALAASMLPICTGSDTGGSLRTPAALCGVVGFRVSPGTVPTERRPLGWTNISVQGPMGRNVADTALLLQAQVRSDGADPHARPIDPALLRPPQPADLGSLRLAVSTDLGFAIVDKRIRAAFEDRVKRIGGWFRDCAWHDPDMAEADETFEVIRARTSSPRISTTTATARICSARTSWRMSSRDWLLGARRRQGACAADEDLPWLPAVLPRARRADLPGSRHPAFSRRAALCRGDRRRAHAHVFPLAVARLRRDADGTSRDLDPMRPRAHRHADASPDRGPQGGDAFVLSVALALEQAMAGDQSLARPMPDLARLAAKPGA
jgi:hypothetical protein